jgi:hypothetical protein
MTPIILSTHGVNLYIRSVNIICGLLPILFVKALKLDKYTRADVRNEHKNIYSASYEGGVTITRF